MSTFARCCIVSLVLGAGISQPAFCAPASPDSHAPSIAKSSGGFEKAADLVDPTAVPSELKKSEDATKSEAQPIRPSDGPTAFEMGYFGMFLVVLATMTRKSMRAKNAGRRVRPKFQASPAAEPSREEVPSRPQVVVDPAARRRPRLAPPLAAFARPMVGAVAALVVRTSSRRRPTRWR